MTTKKKKAYVYRPVLDKTPNEMTARERAELLAHEIMADVQASESELADAIETEITRFANRRDVLFRILRDLEDAGQLRGQAYEGLRPVIALAQKALMCLHIEVESSVADDVTAKVNAALVDTAVKWVEELRRY